MLLDFHVLDTTEHLSKLILQILFNCCPDPPLSGRLYDCKLENQVRLELYFEHAFLTRQAVQKGRHLSLMAFNSKPGEFPRPIFRM
jgi:hypothetical protein